MESQEENELRGGEMLKFSLKKEKKRKDSNCSPFFFEGKDQNNKPRNSIIIQNKN